MPDNNEVNEFLNSGENTPKTVVLDEKGQQSVLDAIRNADITEEKPQEVKEVKMASGTEDCPHCEKTISYTLPEDRHTLVCPNCGKAIPICRDCKDGDCDRCRYVTLANFINVLAKKVSIEKFLTNLEPSLADMSTIADGVDIQKPLTYQQYTNDAYGEAVMWDVKYWDIYGMIVNSMLTPTTDESELLDFIDEIQRKNNE